MVYTNDILEFKEAVKILQKKVEQGYFDNHKWSFGICSMLYCMTENFCSSHDIMEALLTENEYIGLGPNHVLTKDRKVFLEFLAYTLTAEDIYEICNQ